MSEQDVSEMTQMLSSYEEQFLHLLLRTNALKFGSFKTKSGRLSPYFFNTGSLCTGGAMQKAAESYAQKVLDIWPSQKSYFLFGPAYKGMSLVVATAMELERISRVPVYYTFNRKEAKQHGEGGSLIGYEWTKKESGKIIILDDVLTGGTSARESLDLLGARGLRAAGLVVGVDRQEKSGRSELSAKADLEQHAQNGQISVHAILDLDRIITLLYNRPVNGKVYIDDGLMQQISSYRLQYGSQSKT